ncbi:uncharacterized protein LOC116266328 [Nymphaea colorata]|uniref:DUF668 domain-containing protein n=1 Tax=Nymphaea colorata TaxID=210225 RepID=A0A5K0Y7A1_9MAGN|nr:uncharacterized protein LOC116266328 [Nymphaea colorata]VVV73982.1 unnamed protein product [Nymphaea colorata]
MVAETWLVKLGSQVSHNLKHAFFLDDSNKKTTGKKAQTIGILSFEIANVMSKAIHLYKSLAPSEITKIKDVVFKSDGVAFLVSDDEELLLNLFFMEKLDELNRISGVISRLGKKCSEPALQGFEHVYADLLRKRLDFREFGFLVKDMDGVTKKMERYVSATANLYVELEALNELEQTAKKFHQGDAFPKESFRHFEQKIQWQREDVKHLRDVSLWNQTFDKIVVVLARLVCTIYARICLIFGDTGFSFPPPVDGCDLNGGFSTQVELRERMSSYLSGSLEKVPMEKKGTNAKSGPLLQNTELGSFRSTNCVLPCVSGPGKLLKECLSLATSGSFRYDDAELETMSTSSSSSTHSRQMKNGLVGRNSTSSNSQSGAMKESPKADRIRADTPPFGGDHEHSSPIWGVGKNSKSQWGPNLKSGLMSAPPSTVGGSALALHYANVIIIVEKFLRYPHLVGDEARDDLYQMLPTSLRTSLRMSLKSYTKNLASGIYDASLAHDWKEAMDRILTWLAPLAHNMIRWQTERNFEQQHFVPRTNVLLLQTLYFADRAKTESAMCELLVGLNYICRYEQQQNALLDCTSSQEFDDYISWQLQY